MHIGRRHTLALGIIIIATLSLTSFAATCACSFASHSRHRHRYIQARHTDGTNAGTRPISTISTPVWPLCSVARHTLSACPNYACTENGARFVSRIRTRRLDRRARPASLALVLCFHLLARDKHYTAAVFFFFPPRFRSVPWLLLLLCIRQFMSSTATPSMCNRAQNNTRSNTQASIVYVYGTCIYCSGGVRNLYVGPTLSCTCAPCVVFRACAAHAKNARS